MKKTILLAALGLISLSALAQDKTTRRRLRFHYCERKPDYIH